MVTMELKFSILAASNTFYWKASPSSYHMVIKLTKAMLRYEEKRKQLRKLSKNEWFKAHK